MAAFVTTCTVKRGNKVSTASDTFGSVFVKNFTVTVPSTAGNTDTCELTALKFPANTIVIGAYSKANANGPANSAMSMAWTSDAANKIIFGAANNVADIWASASVTAANAFTTTENDTLTLKQSGAANATGAKTIEYSLLCVNMGGAGAPYTTFTN